MMWNFCLQSVFREYGWRFIRRIAAPHPWRTAKAFLQAGAIDISDDMVRLSGGFSPGSRSIVGVGFCLKPMHPPCPSGRPNHDCVFLEHPSPFDLQACRSCTVRELGTLALKAGSAFYIMTSARDILSDVFMPSLRESRFTSAVFLLCAYSLRPFAVGMLASGIQGCLFQFRHGDCRDYGQWLLADRGIKNEQTVIHESSRAAIRGILAGAQRQPAPVQFKRRGNIYFAA